MARSGIRSCPHCEGFVPATLGLCPHCDTKLPALSGPATSAGLSLRTKIVTGLMASSAAMTLMACYGAPCGPDECGFDPGETCDAGGTPEVLAESTLPQTIEGELLAQPGSNSGSCGGEGDDLVYQWTPPAAGDYRVSVTSSADTMLYARELGAEGGACGQELACNDDAESTDPAITLNLTTADPVLLVVDSVSSGQAGSFTLTIEQL